ncbi:YkvR family protein [Oceanobacillus caeni]|uniref:YkvR family protein n=1 Tax=Oceanobacillus caeni TaxID=405946 RepID=UPI00214A49A6|nr:YkvR family protein [Oceanobacillus caeni]MCR1834926.1 YkvR family protein [Oceanobacillus caeni]
MAKVKINDRALHVENLTKDVIQKDGKEALLISFEFQVKSEDYHEITTLLYKNDYRIEIPDEELDFEAVIYNYSTSITNLYEENKVGEFRLELIEKL